MSPRVYRAGCHVLAQCPRLLLANGNWIDVFSLDGNSEPKRTSSTRLPLGLPECCGVRAAIDAEGLQARRTCELFFWTKSGCPNWIGRLSPHCLGVSMHNPSNGQGLTKDEPVPYVIRCFRYRHLPVTANTARCEAGAKRAGKTLNAKR